MKGNLKYFLVMLLALAATGSRSQVLFTYGPHSVTKAEFLNAFSKNNAGTKPDEKAYRNYLDLYIRFKLKVQEAHALKMDTLPSQQSELKTFRGQIADNFMNDDASVQALVEEAAKRSQVDLHIRHIFVSLPANAGDAARKLAEEKINQAYKALQAGESFDQVALRYSEDPSVKQNKGDIGYITALTLPYDLENLAYQTPAGKFSRPYRSSIGYHIFLNAGSRPAAGRMKVAQILLAFPPHASTEQKEARHRLADSLYQVILKGGDFKSLAEQFSNDNISYQIGGELPAFGVGRYEPAFEDAAFALRKDGDLSAPVETEFGYHLIKRLGHTPIPAATDPVYLKNLRQDILQSDRMVVARQALLKKIEKETRFRRNPVNEAWMTAFADSLLGTRPLPAYPRGIGLKTVLFNFGSQQFTVQDWKTYLENIRHYMAMRDGKTPAMLFEEFINKSGLDYYRDHLENFNKSFAAQLKEFKEGNLLFEIMQRKVWDAAAADSAGLRKYFAAHHDRYWWQPSADAVIITCSNDSVARRTKDLLRADISTWRRLTTSGDGSIQGDSGRFEWTQIPVPQKMEFREGMFTPDVINSTDNSSSFACILKVYPDREPRNFADARGYVINDYQNYLEDRWVAALRRKYPVRINEAVFQSLTR